MWPAYPLSGSPWTCFIECNCSVFLSRSLVFSNFWLFDIVYECSMGDLRLLWCRLPPGPFGMQDGHNPIRYQGDSQLSFSPGAGLFRVHIYSQVVAVWSPTQSLGLSRTLLPCGPWTLALVCLFSWQLCWLLGTSPNRNPQRPLCQKSPRKVYLILGIPLLPDSRSQIFSALKVIECLYVFLNFMLHDLTFRFHLSVGIYLNVLIQNGH